MVDTLTYFMDAQMEFETSRVGTDGSLYDANTVEYGLTRGIIGEAEEALEALRRGNLTEAQVEICDVFLFLCTVLNHLHLTPEQVFEVARLKLAINQEKYHVSHFEGRTALEAMAIAKRSWNDKTR